MLMNAYRTLHRPMEETVKPSVNITMATVHTSGSSQSCEPESAIDAGRQQCCQLHEMRQPYDAHSVFSNIRSIESRAPWASWLARLYQKLLSVLFSVLIALMRASVLAS